MNQTIRLLEHADYWEVVVRGGQVNRCIIDYALTVEVTEIEGGNEISARVQCEFLLETGTGKFKLDPEESASLAPALALVHKKIASCKAYKDGTLVAGFVDGSRLTVPPNPRYEAWILNGTGGLIIVSVPNGTLSVWFPREEGEAQG